MAKLRACDACGEADADLAELQPYWTAYGNNCFHFAWAKHDAAVWTCEACAEEWRFCDKCGAAVEAHHYGCGYLPEDYAGDPLCPDCAEEELVA